MAKIAELIDETLTCKDERNKQKVVKHVKELCDSFPLYTNLLQFRFFSLKQKY